MGNLLGPGIVAGNPVQALQNGNEIFPAMLAAIGGVRETITFETYIDWSGDIGKKFSEALCVRARVGVKVHVLLDAVGTGKIKKKFLDDLKSAGVEVERYHPLRWSELLDGGVEIYEYQSTMYHCKVIIVDDAWVSVGSTNFDDRYFRLNDEANLNIYDGVFAAEQVKVFDDDKRQSRVITRAEFKNRSNMGKVFDALAGTLRRQL